MLEFLAGVCIASSHHVHAYCLLYVLRVFTRVSKTDICALQARLILIRMCCLEPSSTYYSLLLPVCMLHVFTCVSVTDICVLQARLVLEVCVLFGTILYILLAAFTCMFYKFLLVFL